MTAVLGALLLAVSAVLFRFAYIHHRRPVPSAWTRRWLASTLVQFTLLMAMAAGFSLALQSVLSRAVMDLSLPEAGEVLVVVAVAALLMRLLNRQWRLFQAEAVLGAGGAPPEPANDPGAGLSPRGGIAGAGRRRAS